MNGLKNKHNMNIELILKNQIAIMEVLESNTNSEWHSENLKKQIYDTDSEIQCCKSVTIMKKDNTQRENLAMKIMLIRDKQMEGLMTFEEALKEAVKLVKEYESE
jgi:hypothetical protein